MTTTNQKYEITRISHKTYPFLHRIRALRDVGTKVKKGELGGFVESEDNLSFELGDEAWIFDDAICAGGGYVDKDSQLHGRAIVCGHAYISQGGRMDDHARAEDNAYVRGGVLMGFARASGNAMILRSADTPAAPALKEHCTVYGTIQGGICVTDQVIVLDGETIRNNTPDLLTLRDSGRTVTRSSARNRLKPRKDLTEPAKPKRKEAAR